MNQDLFTPTQNGQDAEEAQMTALQTVEATPMALIASAIEKGYAPDQLSALMDLQERHERNNAAREFSEAIATFQDKCPPILKERTAGEGGFKYDYAAYEDVWEVAGPHLASVGISVSYSSEMHDKGIVGTIFLRKGIHVETRTMFVPIPDMKVNQTQRYGAAMKYVQRYLLCAALNIVTTNEDTDANNCYDPISDEQAREIEAFMADHNLPLPGFLRYLEVERIADIPADQHGDAWIALRKKVEEKKNARR